MPPVTPSPGMLTHTSGANFSNARSWGGLSVSVPQAVTREVPRCVITVTDADSEERLGENGYIPSSSGSGTGESLQTPISATSSLGSGNSVLLDTARACRGSDSVMYLQESRATSW